MGRADANSRGAVHRFGDTPRLQQRGSRPDGRIVGSLPDEMVMRSATTLGRFADRWREAVSPTWPIGEKK
jgi:hypothetical protein